MSKLEKKFKEFIKTNYELISSLWITKQLIKDLAKIAEKELPITKEKIIEVLDKYGVICGLQEKYRKELFGGREDCETSYEFYGIIANEILGDENDE